MKKPLLLLIVFFSLPISLAQGLAFNDLEAFPAHPTTKNPSGFYLEIRPGDTATDTVTVLNTGNSQMDIRVYSTDTTINNQGEKVLKPYDQERTELGTWITFDGTAEKKFSLSPKEKQTFSFNVEIPENTTEKDYFAGIMVEKLNTLDKEVQDNIVIKTNSRLGLGIKVKVTSSPEKIDRLADYTPSPDWRQTYFYVSLGLFVIALGILGAGYLKKRRHHGKPHHSSQEKK